jgi:hypothetical protein
VGEGYSIGALAMTCGRLGDEFDRTCFIFGDCCTITVKDARGVIAIASMTGVRGRERDAVVAAVTVANGERPARDLCDSVGEGVVDRWPDEVGLWAIDIAGRGFPCLVGCCYCCVFSMEGIRNESRIGVSPQ